MSSVVLLKVQFVLLAGHHPDHTPGHGQGPDQGGVGTLTRAVGAGTGKRGDMCTVDPGHPGVCRKAGHDHAVTLPKVLVLARTTLFRSMNLT